MGACCAPAEDQGPQELQDLPAPTLEGVSDIYRKFELTTAFARTPFGPFEEAVQKAAGTEDFVTFDSLGKELTTPLWKTLADPKSELRQLLSQPAFQSESTDLAAGQIDKDKLILFGILNCVDARVPMKKIRAFYCILQDGGFAAHNEIAAEDKDFAPTFGSICKLASTDLFAAAKAVGDVEDVYSADECGEMEGKLDELAEDGWLDDVFGAKSRLPNEEWVKTVGEKGAWLFDPVALRKRILELAEVEVKHEQ